MAWTNLAAVFIATGIFAYSTTVVVCKPNVVFLASYTPEGQKESVELLVKMDAGQQGSNKTCGKVYKDCLEDINFEGPYVEVCNQTVLCSSMYFECRMQNDSTATEDPLEYPLRSLKEN